MLTYVTTLSLSKWKEISETNCDRNDNAECYKAKIWIWRYTRKQVCKTLKFQNLLHSKFNRFMRNELHNICLLSYNDISQHVCITVSDLILNSIDKIQNIKTILLFKWLYITLIHITIITNQSLFSCCCSGFHRNSHLLPCIGPG